MNKLFKFLLMATAVVGIGLSTTSCSDDDNKDNNQPSEQEQQGEEPRVTFWNVVSQLVDPDEYTDDYEGKTFEPTIGEPDAANPLVRIVAVNNIEAAAQRFAQLVDAPVDENTTSYEYKNDAVGKLTYTKNNDGRSLATVDVDIKQLPRLQQIRFVNPQENDENGLFGFSGTAYYRFGDVIKRRNEDGKEEYWVCVRPCFSKEGKSTSHWITVSPLPKKNVWDYTASTGRVYHLPTGLGKNTEHMQNLAELLYAMMAPHDWYYNLKQSSNPPKFFHDFELKNIQYHNQWFFNKVYEAWDKPINGKTLFQLVFNMQDVDLWKQMSTGGLKFLYSGYSWWTKTSWTCNLFQARYYNGIKSAANMHSEDLTEPEKSMKDLEFDINELYNAESMPLRHPQFFGDNDPRWVIRVAKGKELANNGKEKEQEALAGCEEVYRYNKYYYVSNSIDLKKTEPVITNNGKDRSNVGKIVDQDGRLYNTIQECRERSGIPVAMVVYDTKDMDVDDKANGNILLYRTMDQNLLCISLLSTQEAFAWGDNGNCNVKRYDFDVPGQFANMVRNVFGWSNTQALCNETNGHNHPAAKEVRDKYWLNIHPYMGGFKDSNTSDWVTDWFIPGPAEWRLFLKGMHAWVFSYDGAQVTEHIKEMYKQAGIEAGKQVSINGELFDTKYVIPTEGNFWTSSDANDSQAYTMHIDSQYGARFEKNDKKNAYRVFPFVIMRQLY